MLRVQGHRSTLGEHCERGHADVKKGHAFDETNAAQNKPFCDWRVRDR